MKKGRDPRDDRSPAEAMEPPQVPSRSVVPVAQPSTTPPKADGLTVYQQALKVISTTKPYTISSRTMVPSF